VLLSPRGVESHRFFFWEQIIGLAQQCRHVHVEGIPTGRGRTYLFVWAGDDTKESYTRGPAGNFRETRAKSRIKSSCEFHPCGPGMKSLDISGVREGWAWRLAVVVVSSVRDSRLWPEQLFADRLQLFFGQQTGF
jgi:hypothetical protein